MMLVYSKQLTIHLYRNYRNQIKFNFKCDSKMQRMEIGLIRFNEADFVQYIEEEERKTANAKIWGNRTFFK